MFSPYSSCLLVGLMYRITHTKNNDWISMTLGKIWYCSGNITFWCEFGSGGRSLSLKLRLFMGLDEKNPAQWFNCIIWIQGDCTVCAPLWVPVDLLVFESSFSEKYKKGYSLSYLRLYWVYTLPYFQVKNVSNTFYFSADIGWSLTCDWIGM